MKKLADGSFMLNDNCEEAVYVWDTDGKDRSHKLEYNGVWETEPENGHYPLFVSGDTIFIMGMPIMRDFVFTTIEPPKHIADLIQQAITKNVLTGQLFDEVWWSWGRP